MSNKYKHGDTIPLSVIVMRVKDLADAVTRGDFSEFTMRVPVELDRDADVVLLDAAKKLESLQQKFTKSEERVKEYQEREQMLVNYINSRKQTMPQFKTLEAVEEWLDSL